jgi:uncharacterized membrane protein
MSGGYEWMWWIHWVWGIAWTVLVVGAAVWLFRSPGSTDNHPRHETPLEILQRTYAEGKVTTEEYEERKKHLTES